MSMSAVATRRIPTAIQWLRVTSTYTAHTASAFVTQRNASLIPRPTLPENSAIARASSPGRNGSGVTGGLMSAAVAMRAGREGAGAGRARPRGPISLADLVGDRAGCALEGARGRHCACALRRADPRLAEVTPDAGHLRDVRHRNATLARGAE